jgi:hypothetical protein
MQSALDLFVDVKGVESGTEELVFNLTAGSAGDEVNRRDNVKNLTLPLTTQTDIGLSG